MSSCVFGILYKVLLAICWILSTVDGQSCHLYDDTNTLLTSPNTLLTLECSFFCGASNACTKFRICREFHQENCTLYRTVSKINCGDSASNTVCILFTQDMNRADQLTTVSSMSSTTDVQTESVTTTSTVETTTEDPTTTTVFTTTTTTGAPSTTTSTLATTTTATTTTTAAATTTAATTTTLDPICVAFPSLCQP